MRVRASIRLRSVRCRSSLHHIFLSVVLLKQFGPWKKCTARLRYGRKKLAFRNRYDVDLAHLLHRGFDLLSDPGGLALPQEGHGILEDTWHRDLQQRSELLRIRAVPQLL